MSFINKAIRKHFPCAKRATVQTHDPKGEPQTAPRHSRFTVVLHADRSRVSGLRFDPERNGFYHDSDGHPHDDNAGPRDTTMFAKEERRDALGVLRHPGGCHFITKANKKWFIKWTEFSFVLNPKELKAA